MTSRPPNPVEKPRVLVFMPSWLGDSAMATPALRLLRDALPSSVIVGLCRPGIDELLSGTDLLDDLMVADARSVLGPAKVAARLVPMRFDAAALLPNSFAAAITVRLAGIPRRIGYDRDGRSALLTHRLHAPRRSPPHVGWAPVPAVDYYLGVARGTLDALGHPAPNPPPPVALELATTRADDERAEAIFTAGGLRDSRPPLTGPHAGPEPFALLNPGGNNPAKRWPVERFAALAHHLIDHHKLRVVINGSPAEAPLVKLIRDVIALDNHDHGQRCTTLPELGNTIGSLKAIVRAAKLVVTNDTGPRHIAAAFDRPCVTLFGPTDPRWTTLPLGRDGVARERVLVADPTLPPDEVADDHPDRCRVDKITTPTVIAAVDELLAR